METKPDPASSPRELIRLAETEPDAARAALAARSLEEQVAAVCETPLAMRMRLLDLVESPEDLIPRLPEAELCFTCKAVGIGDAGWLIALATPRQIVACLDLDVWSGLSPDIQKLDEWMASIAEAGDTTIFTAAGCLDTELLALYLRAHVDVELKPAGDEDWQPPEGGQTLEGQFYLTARHKNDDLAALLRVLHVVFQKDYWLYFRLMHSVREESELEIQEWALRWRTGRLEDLGFPSWDRSMRIYGFLRPERLADLPEGGDWITPMDWDLPVWITQLPAHAESGHRLFRAVAELSTEERARFFYAFIAVANQVAVADGCDLGDALTLPNTIEKTALVGSRGLEHIATEHQMADVEVLRRVPLERLFRVGVNLAPENVRPALQDEEDEADGEVE
ncbi:MAG: DUF6178 family protein [Myxococcota bacterium]|nr:DUF6178 family protein [Myxococcota bacterium]